MSRRHLNVVALVSLRESIRQAGRLGILEAGRQGRNLVLRILGIRAWIHFNSDFQDPRRRIEQVVMPGPLDVTGDLRSVRGYHLEHASREGLAVELDRALDGRRSSLVAPGQGQQ